MDVTTVPDDMTVQQGNDGDSSDDVQCISSGDETVKPTVIESTNDDSNDAIMEDCNGDDPIIEDCNGDDPVINELDDSVQCIDDSSDKDFSENEISDESSEEEDEDDDEEEEDEEEEEEEGEEGEEDNNEDQGGEGDNEEEDDLDDLLADDKFQDKPGLMSLLESDEVKAIEDSLKNDGIFPGEDNSLDTPSQSSSMGQSSSNMMDPHSVSMMEQPSSSMMEPPSDPQPGPSTPKKAKKRKRKAADGDEPKKKRKKGKKKKDKSDKTRKKAYERRNIRGIMKDDQLDENTLAAQQEEAERKARLQKTLEMRQNVLMAMMAKKREETSKHSELKSLLELDEPAEAKDEAAPKTDKAKPKRESDAAEASSSDDDCVIIESDPEEEEAAGEDPNNSGCHVNDSMNQPDHEGRVLVNVGHPNDEPDIYLAPQLAATVKPHQIGGIRFLYDNLVESLERYKTSNGFGCILAHSMGLGKTIQMTAFIDIFLRFTEANTVLVIVPVNTLQNWLNEFNMWLPKDENIIEEYKDKVLPRKFELYMINDNHKNTAARAKVIDEWSTQGGVLLLGYEMYRLLCSKKIASHKPRRKKNEPLVYDVDEEDRNKELMEKIHSALMRPGPDLVVCDEGHRIKNSHASTSQSLKNIRTKRRVVLTGYPLQNNMLEYWCMVDFVRPNFLGTKTEFSNMFERPITNGQCNDSTPQDVKLMRFRAHVLHSLLEGFVQRRSHTVLRQSLPIKEEHVLLVRMSPMQRKLYKELMDSFAESGTNGPNPLKAFAVCCKIWNHPDVLYLLMQQRKLDDRDLEIDLEAPSEMQFGKKSRSRNQAKSKQQQQLQQKRSDSPYTQEDSVSSVEKPPPPPSSREGSISYEWANGLFSEYTAGLLENGGKMVLLMTIIEESLRVGDKLLVFSQSLFTLDLIEDFLALRYVPIPGMQEKWAKNRNYFRLDGSSSSIDREKMINQFNDPMSGVHVFLLSTKAGCLGINLIGANRVVVFDASWNPCHDSQAVCRVYRYGQMKPCYVYRLVTDNTMENKIYERQINKQGISNRVIDEMNPDNFFAKGQIDQLLKYEDQDLPILEKPEVAAEKHEDPVMRTIIRRHSFIITKEPFTHESLLLDKKESKLTKSEKRLAKQGYEMEKKMNISYSRQNYQAYYSKGNFSTSRIHNLATDRPMATVRPIMSTPIPMTPRPSTSAGNNASIPINTLLKPGVSVHQIKTTTDIFFPGTNTSTDSSASSGGGQNKIPAGQNVLVIKTPKGVYIRTNSGRLFAVRGKTSTTTGAETTSTTSTSHATSGGTLTVKSIANSMPSAIILKTAPTVSGGKVIAPRAITDLKTQLSALASLSKITVRVPKPTADKPKKNETDSSADEVSIINHTKLATNTTTTNSAATSAVKLAISSTANEKGQAHLESLLSDKPATKPSTDLATFLAGGLSSNSQKSKPTQDNKKVDKVETTNSLQPPTTANSLPNKSNLEALLTRISSSSMTTTTDSSSTSSTFRPFTTEQTEATKPTMSQPQVKLPQPKQPSSFASLLGDSADRPATKSNVNLVKPTMEMPTTNQQAYKDPFNIPNTENFNFDNLFGDNSYNSMPQSTHTSHAGRTQNGGHAMSSHMMPSDSRNMNPYNQAPNQQVYGQTPSYNNPNPYYPYTNNSYSNMMPSQANNSWPSYPPMNPYGGGMPWYPMYGMPGGMPPMSGYEQNTPNMRPAEDTRARSNQGDMKEKSLLSMLDDTSFGGDSSDSTDSFSKKVDSWFNSQSSFIATTANPTTYQNSLPSVNNMMGGNYGYPSSHAYPYSMYMPTSNAGQSLPGNPSPGFGMHHTGFPSVLPLAAQPPIPGKKEPGTE